MSYSIPLSDKSVLTTVPDGSFNNQYSNINLIGKNFVGFGQLMNENFIHILENFSNINPPANPLKGQLWYDSGKNILKVFIGDNNWIDIAFSQVSEVRPNNPRVGDQWWDKKNDQINFWSGEHWVVIGPNWTKSQGLTGTQAETVVDNGGTSHILMKFYIEKKVVGVWSKDTTFVLADEFIIPGISATINPGLTFALLGSMSQNINGSQVSFGGDSFGFGYTGSKGYDGYTGSAGVGYTGSAGTGINIGSANQILFKNSQNTVTGSSNLTYDMSTLTVSGDFIASGDITAFSDESLKSQVETITNALPLVLQLRGVNYVRIENGEPGTGAIAQEVEKVIPSLVKTTKEGVKTVNYGGFAGIFIEAIKAQQAQIDELKKQLDQLNK